MSIENKTLSEVLTERKDRKIKIGAVGGSSFFFCGPCELFIERADDYDKDLKAAANNTAISARKLFEGLLKKPMTSASWEWKSSAAWRQPSTAMAKKSPSPATFW